jgi:hypothetical protein
VLSAQCSVLSAQCSVLSAQCSLQRGPQLSPCVPLADAPCLPFRYCHVAFLPVAIHHILGYFHCVLDRVVVIRHIPSFGLQIRCSNGGAQMEFVWNLAQSPERVKLSQLGFFQLLSGREE